MLDDIRFGARTFLRNPGFAALAGLTLALGIAANTAMFSVVNGVLLRPLPFADPDRIVVINTPSAARTDGSHSARDFEDLIREQQSFSALAGYRTDLFAVVAPTGQALQFEGVHVTAGFFDVFGVSAAAGRAFTMEADRRAGGSRVVISGKAAAALAADPESLVGQSVQVNSVSTLIVGVMPNAFSFPDDDTDVWLLASQDVPPSPLGDATTDRELRYFHAVARLRSDRSAAAIQGDLDRIAAQLNAQRQADAEPRRLTVTPLHDDMVEGVSAAIVILQIGVGVVLLIACVNISSLLIARTTGRQRELAVRAALGAGRLRILRQLLTESLLLGVVGGALGLLCGQWGVSALIRVLPDTLPRVGEVAVDGTVAVVTLVAAVLASVLFGAVPALQASTTSAAGVLRATDGRTMTGRSMSRSALVVVEVALTLVLLVAAGLLSSSLSRLQEVDPGFDAAGVTVGNIGIPQTRYADGDQQSAFYRRLLEELATRGEFESVATGFPAPLSGDNASGTFSIVGRSTPAGAERPFAHLNNASPGFFRTMGIPIVEGRGFEDGDLTGPPVAVVSATLARKYWPTEGALGRQLTFDEDSTDPPFTIVGVSGDVRQLGLRDEAPPLIYFPYTQFPLPFATVAVKSAVPDDVAAAGLTAAVRAVDPDAPLPNIRSLRSVVDQSLADDRFRAFVFGVLAFVALALAAVGVYGLVSYSVAQHTREIGIRVALGASPRQVLTSTVSTGATLALLGVGVGLIGAWFAAQALSRFLFGVGAADPATFVGVSAILIVVAMCASYLPARRALRVDPVTALRAE